MFFAACCRRSSRTTKVIDASSTWLASYCNQKIRKHQQPHDMSIQKYPINVPSQLSKFWSDPFLVPGSRRFLASTFLRIYFEFFSNVSNLWYETRWKEFKSFYKKCRRKSFGTMKQNLCNFLQRSVTTRTYIWWLLSVLSQPIDDLLSNYTLKADIDDDGNCGGNLNVMFRTIGTGEEPRVTFCKKSSSIVARAFESFFVFGGYFGGVAEQTSLQL